MEATDKSASIRLSFSVGAAAEDLSKKLSGVTVKIKGIKLHAFVRVSRTAKTTIGIVPMRGHMTKYTQPLP